MEIKIFRVKLKPNYLILNKNGFVAQRFEMQSAPN